MLVLAANFPDHPKKPLPPPEESQNFARQLLSTADQVADTYLEIDARGAPRTVTRIDHLPWLPGDIATGGNSVWVVQDGGQEVLRFDARTGRAAGRFEISGDPTGANADGVAYADGSLWLGRGNGVARVDPSNGRVLHRFATPARYVVFADGAVWAGEPGTGTIWKIDPASNRVDDGRISISTGTT